MMRKFYYKLLTKAISRYFKSPQFLILYLTNECWMKCKHCFYNEEFRKTNKIKNEILSLNELEKIADSINRILYLSLTGGEPFIREDLEEIIKLFTRSHKVFRYQMPTSGYKTSIIVEKTQRILKDNPRIPFRIHVSLDGNEDAHENIRSKKGSFNNAIETIIELNKLKKEFQYFDVSIVTTICSYNQDILNELGEIVKRIHHDGEWCINLIRGEPRNRNASVVDMENYSKVNELIDKRIKDGSYKGYSGHLTSKWLSAKNAARRKIIDRIQNNNYKGGGCSAGSIAGVIYPDGSVFPCELLDNAIGNLRDYDYNLPLLWNSEKADRIRNRIQDENCLCTHECNLSTNFLIQPRTWPALLHERMKLFVNG
jgi:radical SAM protein with 4Fe4S-binding SPASM domain